MLGYFAHFVHSLTCAHAHPFYEQHYYVVLRVMRASKGCARAWHAREFYWKGYKTMGLGKELGVKGISVGGIESILVCNHYTSLWKCMERLLFTVRPLFHMGFGASGTSWGGLITLTSWAHHLPSGPPGETRIMDLDQYLEKMNTNTNVIWIPDGLFYLLRFFFCSCPW